MGQLCLRRQSGARRLCAAFSVCLALSVGPAIATTYTVTNLSDSGSGSLRDAIDQANRNTGADIIAFQAGLTGAITLGIGVGQIDIFDPLTINGPGPGRISISGNNVSRIFNIYPPAGSADVFTVAINGLKFTAGNSTDEGGAILVGDSNLSLQNCEFRNNSALRGGGVYAFPVEGSTTLTVRDSLFDSNSASADGGAFGAQDIDNVIVSGVVASNNSAVRNGGAAFLRAGNTTITTSRFETNHAATSPPGVGGPSGGGAIRLDGSKPTAIMSVSEVRFTGNTSAFGWGGALSMTVGAANLDRMQLNANTANTLGGALSAYAIAMTMSNSSFGGNSANQAGGAIAFDTSGSMAMTNITLSGNSSNASNGGGIYSGSNTTLSVTSSTIVGNSANGSGGGVKREGINASLLSTIVANNTAATGPDLSGNFLPNSSLIKNTSGATLTAGNGNLSTGLDPLLGPLAVNGGPTLTLLPTATSPVLNAGDPSASGLPPTDQRGLARISGGRVDIGAVERQTPEDVIFRGVF
ncbi:MAG: choice-of-anchor Q domain-containing protein [Tahibacter sp.]